MSSRFPLRVLWAALSLAAPALAQAGGDGAIDPLQTQTCNEPPPLAGRARAANLTGTPLPPGGDNETNGTRVADAEELDGLIVISETRDFSFGIGPNTVAGKYTEIVSQGSDGFCKSHVQVAVMKGCITHVRVLGFVHDSTLVADWRRDFPGNVPSSRVVRSSANGNNKTRVTFTMNGSVCEGQTTRFLLLNTNVNVLALGNTLQFKPLVGGLSPAFPFRVPLP